MHKCAAPSRADAFATDASASFANGIRSSMIGAGRTAAGRSRLEESPDTAGQGAG